MLSAKYRFHSRGGVRYVYQKGKTIRTPIMSLVHIQNDHGFTRFAVVISKKVLKTAVGRNRIRRRVYEAIRLELAQMPNANLKHDFIFVIFSTKLLSISFSELRQQVHTLLEEALIS